MAWDQPPGLLQCQLPARGGFLQILWQKCLLTFEDICLISCLDLWSFATLYTASEFCWVLLVTCYNPILEGEEPGRKGWTCSLPRNHSPGNCQNTHRQVEAWFLLYPSNIKKRRERDLAGCIHSLERRHLLQRVAHLEEEMFSDLISTLPSPASSARPSQLETGSRNT